MTARRVPEELRAHITTWRRRRRQAFAVRVVTSIIAVLLVGSAVTLLLGSLSFLPADYQPTRYVPGGNGSVSLNREAQYVLVKPGEALPGCTVQDAEGATVLVDSYTAPSDEGTTGLAFFATPGSYTVTCEGGNDGVVALVRDDYEYVLRGPLDLRRPAIPLALAGIAVYVAGRWAAGRIAPESMRPLYPS